MTYEKLHRYQINETHLYVPIVVVPGKDESKENGSKANNYKNYQSCPSNSPQFL